MLKLNRGDQAKRCFMEALALDVKCYEAFEQLVNGEMMTPEEGTSSFQLNQLISAHMQQQSGSLFILWHIANRLLRMQTLSN